MKKLIDLEKIKEEYYKKLDEDYDQIEFWENDGEYQRENEFEDFKRKKAIEEKGQDPFEELPY
ncbi:hypothetical protein [Ornithinibacillus halophilus]|uniref:Uncharacterized protein n=1 Tax=Ornithinibacillus halophilus TaxID=930117 RepID=A0A1M5G2P4_9BACI|nr:hypothetical protein [Ornithinibacillus halophilus]SHF98003.1 hypothetical protein SAMN05216225_101140 [Ornithinibacillus halophilus]